MRGHTDRNGDSLLKPMIWEDKVSQEFVDITIKYLEEDAPLGDIDYDPYVKTTDEKFRDDISTGYRDSIFTKKKMILKDISQRPCIC